MVAVRTFAAIGTICHVLATDEASMKAATAITKRQLDELDRTCSRFRPDSELMQLPHGRPTSISPLLTELLAASLRAARRTNGLVDPTVGQTLRDLGYDDDLAIVQARISDASAPVRAAPGYWRIALDEVNQQVLIPRGVEIDLGALAKAWAADRAARTCADELPGGFLVNLGGDIALGGPTPGDGWQVALDDTTEPDPLDWPVIALRTGGLATSSTAVRTWWRGVREVHHIVDPRSGDMAEPVWRAVTVAAESAELANTASTAAIVLGRDAARWLAHRGLPARLMSREKLPVYVGDWPAERSERASTGSANSGLRSKPAA
jgi:FAD:protein FMN transferase